MRSGRQPARAYGIVVYIALAVLLVIALSSCGDTVNPLPGETLEALPSATATPGRTVPVPSSSATLLQDTPTFIPDPTATPVPPTPTRLPAPTATVPVADTPAHQRSRYALSARLDYLGHHLAVSQTITYVNTYDGPLPDLLLVVEPHRRPGVFRLTGLSWGDGAPVGAYTLDGARLGLALPEPLAPGAQISLDIAYELDLPAGPSTLGYTARQTNLGDWYPFVPPWRAGQGWLVHEPGAVGEHLVYDVADYAVEIDLVDPSPDLTIVASGLVGVDGGRHRYRLEAARSFAWSVGSEYIVLTEAVGTTTVASCVFPEHVVAGEAVLKTTTDALALYAELFGPYPHAELVTVEAHFPDGMEYDGLYFLGSEYYAAYAGNPQGYLTAIAAHETAHQWWYGLVGNDQALEPWLDEALCIYSERLFFERGYPELVDWWWGFRVTRFEPVGWVDSTIYEHNGFRPYVDAVYLRGALFLEGMRELVGDEAFFAFLRDYVARNSYAQVTAEDFLAILAEHSQANLGGLLRMYLAVVE